MFYYPVFWNYMNYYAFAWMTYKLHHEEAWFDLKTKEFEKSNPWIFDEGLDGDDYSDVFFDCEDIELLNMV